MGLQVLDLLIQLSLLVIWFSFVFWTASTMRWMRDVLDITQTYGAPALTCAAVYYVTKKLVNRVMRKRAIAARGAEATKARDFAEAYLQSAIEEDFLTTDGKPIVDLSLEELREALKAGRVTAVHAARAFMKKALEVSHATNCVVEPLAPDVCEAIADQMDTEYLSTADKSKLGLLHGLPLSLKENVDIAGMYSTCGVLSRCKHHVGADADIVRVLRYNGAVPYVKTNVPQTLISFDCSNPLYGATRNPHNLARSPGGSSGGEAALIAAGGSHLGIGTDIGGSVRTPAAFCGVCGFKPTTGRVSNTGIASILKGQSGVSYSAGVMARKVAGCQLLMKALCCQYAFDIDPTLAMMPFDEDACYSKRKLRIGYFLSTEFFEATPAAKRAVIESRDALRAAGHEVVEMNAPDMFEVMSMYYKLMLADGADTVMDSIRGDDVDVSISYGYFLYHLPTFLLRLMSGAMHFTWHRMTAMVSNFRKRSVQDLWQLQLQREMLAKDFLCDVKSAGLDGFICPAHPSGPPRLGECGKQTASLCYVAIANLFNMPAGVVPVTTITQEDEDALGSYPHNDPWGWSTKSNAKGMVGMPMAVQCVTLPYRDETCLYLMQELETSLAKS